MTNINQATEMLLAFSSLLKDLQEELDSGSELPSNNIENLDAYQLVELCEQWLTLLIESITISG